MQVVAQDRGEPTQILLLPYDDTLARMDDVDIVIEDAISFIGGTLRNTRFRVLGAFVDQGDPTTEVTSVE